MNYIPRSFLVLPFFLLPGCTSDKENIDREAVIIAIEGDVDSFNPLFAEETIAGEINDLLFPALLGSDFDSGTGTLSYTPLLAHRWEFSNERKDVTFHLVTDARWSDGVPVTARDIQVSYELYGNPEVASVRQFVVEYFRRTDGELDISKSVEVIDDSTVTFHFEKSYSAQLFDAGLPILPAHVYGNIPPAELRTHPVNKAPVGSGPFLLASWTPLQEIVLKPNPTSTVPHPAKLAELVFRVLPDPQTRLAQLQAGEIDLVAGLAAEDARLLEDNAPFVQIISTAGRDYDFVGWNNIDPEEFEARGGSAAAHPLFGNSNVRRALTMSINRNEIVDAYLGQHGRVALGGVSPLFTWAYNHDIEPVTFNPNEALALFGDEGWTDSDQNGILDRNGEEFAFTLYIPAGGELRSAVAAIIQQQLRNVMIEATIEQVERGTFWDNLMSRKYEAWIAGFSVPLQMQLTDLWGSDLERYPFNLTGFRNEKVDEILATTSGLVDETEGAELWKEFQMIVHDQQPCTFLFWINNIVGIHSRVKGTEIGVLGTTHKAWEWYLAESVAASIR